MDKVQILLVARRSRSSRWASLGVIIRRNVLVMLMCMELMLNGVNLSLVTFAHQTGSTVGAVLVFLIFVVATAEIADRHPDRAAAGAPQAHARPRRLRGPEGIAR